MATIKARKELSRQEHVLKALFVANGTYGILQNSDDVPHLIEAINMMRESTRLNTDFTLKFLNKFFKENFGEYYGKGSSYDAKAFFDIEFDKTQKKFIVEFHAKCPECNCFRECGSINVFDFDEEDVFGENQHLCDECFCVECDGLCSGRCK